MRFLILSFLAFSVVMGYPYYQAPADPYYQSNYQQNYQPIKLWYTPQTYQIGTGVVPSTAGNQNPYNPYYPYYPYDWSNYNSDFYNPYNN
ncbi:Protein CBG19193 [Caenorhabditis briggsae]|uniref:Uncharacterized protein n=2 Tax=Caenorhabditis briggsae TaxID=6238 RepID=A0AAE9JMM4_CAEBR|nr:Protein CBG19193 [Caenorhabditis briggsae]ULT90660.1 hypothetical protein L3Y34_008764 [Caenorhabditis briggsae]UMM36437.1 hypothetical protein L5515_008604 [Caenorhabditis briggsae]CAP36485.1 Protein CBG19193 [Caenorhabditis briggsae]